MEHEQLLRILLCLLTVQQCLTKPLGGECVDESFCAYNLQDYHSQLVNLPSHINERSIATWSIVENLNLNRIPQLIHEASCDHNHACRGLENSFGVETIPVTLRMPVLKKNPACFSTGGYSLEYEAITVACICAIARNN